ncbi:hypothetical protein P3T76_008998 [Phytophthora citrophthora]|uniref:Uncharacterized protein n=1 Tax=Phytophthora citrophthora TaxID=4793 RepID=A0AAD9GIB1_9STRA|nr:hypothetical protein P3T76_008998 [Phytophthora citrophthora]
MEGVTRIVERLIAAEMAASFGLIFDGWSHASEHFIAVFACYEVDGVMKTPSCAWPPYSTRSTRISLLAALRVPSRYAVP